MRYPHSDEDSDASASRHSNQEWERDPGILGVNETEHDNASSNLYRLEADQDILCTHDTDQESRDEAEWNVAAEHSERVHVEVSGEVLHLSVDHVVVECYSDPDDCD